MNRRVWVWGVPFAPLRRAEASRAVESLIEAGKPAYFITANTHYAMLSARHPELEAINEGAAFILADGTPIVWASRPRLPERVAGSDLIYDLCELSAARGFRVFLLGGPEGVADTAADRLGALYPGLQIVGTACPPHRPLTETEHQALLSQIREARPHLLFVAFGQPKGELWIGQNLGQLGSVVCVQVGASLDFVAGRVKRAPRWMGRAGLEWAYRLALEPRRLAPRYAANARFLARNTLTDAGRRLARVGRGSENPVPKPSESVDVDDLGDGLRSADHAQRSGA